MDTQFLALQRTMLQQTSHNILANNLFFSKLNLKKKKKVSCTEQVQRIRAHVDNSARDKSAKKCPAHGLNNACTYYNFAYFVDLCAFIITSRGVGKHH